ncbi:MAG: glycosyltransferase [Abditibacteriales bacterium]|nr:glycosyltransferase [Abditibacteriales bacterium]MDW8367185.1 glycosyltransferase [Abditibacteriales bacterium]
MNVLLFPSPATDVWTRAFRRAYSVVTVGAAGTGQYDLLYDRARDSVRDVVERLPHAWAPDFCFIASVDYYDFPLGLEDSPIPTVAVFGDYFLCFDLMRRAAPFLDLVIAIGEELIEPLRAYGANRVVALPWFGLDEETFKPLPCEKIYDLCVVGNLHPHVQRRRSKFLEERLPRWLQRYRVFFGNVYGEDYVRVLNQSKIVFNRSILGHANMRVFETLGCGSLAVIEDTNWQTKQLFKEGEHIVCYNDENIEDIFDYYLTHDDERERIAAAGRAAALARHTYAHRAEQIVALVQETCGGVGVGKWERNAQKISMTERKGESAAVMFYLHQWDTAKSLCEDALRQPDAPAHLWNDAAVIAAQKAQAAGQFNVQTLDQMDALLQRGMEADATNPLLHFHRCIVAHLRASQGTTGTTRPQTTGQRQDEVTGNSHALVTDHWSPVTDHWSLVTGHWREFLAHLAARPDDVPRGLLLCFTIDRFRMEWERALLERNPRRLNDLLRWQAHVYLGDALTQLQEWEDAQRAYQQALTYLPDDGYVCHKLGKVYLRLGDAPTAMTYFECAVRYEPFFAAAQQDLACLLADGGLRRAPSATHQPILGETQMDTSSTTAPVVPMSETYYRIAHAFEGTPQDVRLIQQRFATYFKGRRKVLDIGCGQGVFLEVLREQGCDPEGVDIDPEMVALARAKGLTVHCGDLLSFLEERENAYDGIYAANIIEHFNGRDATRLMLLCARALRPDGVLVMVTPNFRHPLVREEVFWLDITHVRPYPPALLAKMMESVGLKVADIGTCPEGLNDVYIAGVKATPHHRTAGRQDDETRDKGQGVNSPTVTGRWSLLWEAPLFDPSGYADEARQFVLGLDSLGVRVRAQPIAWSERVCDLDERTQQRLQALLHTPLNGNAVHVQHIFPPFFKHDGRAVRRIGRTMFETDRLPPEWVAACNAMDEIWVPTQFNVETFTRSGVKEKKLFVVPGPLDSQAYDPNLPPLVIPERRGFNFLSVFDWSLRKGWDVLLRAFVEEFSPDEDVALLLKVYSSYGLSIADLQARAAAFIANELKRDVERIPDIVFIEDILSTAAMPRLFKAADAYVMPSRCEGWGRPFMEAMAMGLPTIGTRWSGNTEFMTDENSYLIDPVGIVDVPDIALQEVPTYRGHKWAEPSVEHLRQLMRYVFEHRDAAREKGSRARQDVISKYDASVVCRKIVERLENVMPA